MSAGRCTRTVVDVWVAPGDAIAALHARPALAGAFVVLGGASALLLVLQALLLEPALRLDPALADLPLPPAAPLRWLRFGLAVVAPVGMLLRALTLGSVLHALTLPAGGCGRWQHSVSLVLHLEAIFVLETAATVLLLAVDRPVSWEAARALHLRAGVDLLWQPDAPPLARACAAANAFTVWWGVLLVRGVSHLAALPRRTASMLVLPLWATTVVLRFLLQPR